jgi:hypothetical protein
LRGAASTHWHGWRNPLPFADKHWFSARQARRHVDAHDNRGGHKKKGFSFRLSPFSTPHTPTAKHCIPGHPSVRTEPPNRRFVPRTYEMCTRGGSEYFVRTLKQTCSQDCPRAPLAFKDSMTHVFCNSHYVSHFAAFFIDVGAKISSVTSFISWFSNSFGCFRFWVLEKVCVCVRLRGRATHSQKYKNASTQPQKNTHLKMVYNGHRGLSQSPPRWGKR